MGNKLSCKLITPQTRNFSEVRPISIFQRKQKNKLSKSTLDQSESIPIDQINKNLSTIKLYLEKKESWTYYSPDIIQLLNNFNCEEYITYLYHQFWIDNSSLHCKLLNHLQTSQENAITVSNISRKRQNSQTSLSMQGIQDRKKIKQYLDQQKAETYEIDDSYNQTNQKKLEDTKFLFSFISKELTKEDNIIHHLIMNFSSLFNQRYFAYIKNFKENNKLYFYLKHNNKGETSFQFKQLPKEEKQIRNTILNQAISDVKAFFKLIHQIINIIFNNIFKEYEKFQKDNTLKKIVDKNIFNQKFLITTILMQLIQLSMQDDVYRFYILMQALKNIKTKHYGMSDKFKLIQEKKPYYKVMQMFKFLDKCITPNQKFEQLTKVKQEIINSVDSYYENYGDKQQKKILIDPDNFLEIFSYCIVKAECKLLPVYQKFMLEFTNTTLMTFGEGAFLFTNFTIGLQYLLNMSKNKNAGKKQLITILQKADLHDKIEILKEIDFWIEKENKEEVIDKNLDTKKNQKKAN